MVACLIILSGLSTLRAQIPSNGSFEESPADLVVPPKLPSADLAVGSWRVFNVNEAVEFIVKVAILTGRYQQRAGVHWAEPADQPVRLLADYLKGNWKLYQEPGDKPTPAQLFDLAADPQEKTDLAAKFPDKMTTLKQAFDTWAPGVEADAAQLASA